MDASMRRRVEIARELALRRGDPLLKALGELTTKEQVRFGNAQLDYVLSEKRERLLDGGNRSGKTWTGSIDFLAMARGVHPTYVWPPKNLPPRWSGGAWVGWWGAVKYDLFGVAAWRHFKRLLLFPGESVRALPTRNICAISWNKKNPEVPDYLQVRRFDGNVADIYIMSYEADTDAWSSAAVDAINYDEEAPPDKVNEGQLRIVDRCGRIGYLATALKNMDYEVELRARAEAGDPDVFHGRLSMRDNPAIPPTEIKALERKYANDPETLRLRVDGYPSAEEGKIYPDSIWQPPGMQRVVKPFPITREWTKYRCIDHGVHTVACIWVAVAPAAKKIVMYREYYGYDVEPPLLGNALEILRLSELDGGERAYHQRWIDPATMGAGQETGTRLIDLWNRAGYCASCGETDVNDWGRCQKCQGERVTIDVTPAPDNRVEPGIELCKNLLRERCADGSPLFVVFDTCTNFQNERRNYGRHIARERGDEGHMKPVKKKDHGLDDWRYLVAGGLEWVQPARIAPTSGIGKMFLERRMKNKGG